ncbi:hypothetical protein [Parasitella parasitica]|uniref:Uncharacterized protein n=1 Tax=Parasitella parasitica TaxID=35722 RepID=A0A0B7NQA9_9FUNG|nr:hypothetical protein [Parasitella parasitica]
MTQQRNNLALRAINPAFRLDNDTEVNYTLPLDEFQQTLVQQTAARKATREATVNKKQRRFNRTSSNFGSASGGSDSSFFRSGPPSGQGGFSNNSNSNNSSNYSSNNYTYSNNNGRSTRLPTYHFTQLQRGQSSNRTLLNKSNSNQAFTR